MMDTITDKNFQVAVVEHHRNVYGDFLVGILQETIQAFFEVQLSRRSLKPGVGGLIDVEFVTGHQRGHGQLSSDTPTMLSASIGANPRVRSGTRNRKSGARTREGQYTNQVYVAQGKE